MSQNRYAMNYNPNNTLQSIADKTRFNGISPVVETLGQSSPLNFGGMQQWGQPSPNEFGSFDLGGAQVGQQISPLNLGGAAPPALSSWDKLKGLFGNSSQEGGNLFGEMTKDGWQPSGLSSAFNMGSQLFGAWGGMQDRKLAKKQFNFSKEAFNKQYDTQKRLVNSQLEDRQQRRESEGTARTSTAEYMKKNEVR